MAYSDYGGYAYKNGKRVVERSDAVITDAAQSIPGMYPGFAFVGKGMDAEEAMKASKDNPNGHAVLGDAPVYVGLYKQSDVTVWIDGKELRLDDLLYKAVNLPAEYIFTSSYDGRDYIDIWKALEDSDTFAVTFDLSEGFILDVVWAQEDNLYVYARLTMPDGTRWHGWSGYGVGAGLEDCGYGFSTLEREITLKRLWPEAIIGVSEPPLLS